EVAGGIWDMVYRFPFNLIGRTVERIYSYFYKKVKVITISESTKKDLQKIGFAKDSISVIPLGCNVPIIKSLPKKNKRTTLVFVARLTMAKGIEDAIASIALLKEKIPNILMEVVGRGEDEYTAKLKQMVEKLGLKKHITFQGFIDEKGKWDILGRA